ncbi:MAG: phage Gp37/Gp68 family protein [Candidatus Aenigmatarchaeota archaeon]
MKTTKIEWTEKVWNPSIGCNKVSAGCKFCYAENFAKRLKAMGVPDYSDGFKFKILPHRLQEPLKIKKPTKFFVNSMSDLFHEKMPFEYLDMIFDIIQQTPQHTYQILTKRDERMAEYFKNKTVPSNVWLGVSVENSNYTYRIDTLRKIKAKVRFISFEPLIGSVGKINLKGIHWAIVGGESGKKARKIKKEWVEEIFNQCKKYKVAFFFKQWGTWGADEIKRNKKANGRKFKGRVWNEFPKQVVSRKVQSNEMLKNKKQMKD